MPITQALDSSESSTSATMSRSLSPSRSSRRSGGPSLWEKLDLATIDVGTGNSFDDDGDLDLLSTSDVYVENVRLR